jgi:RHS repeat-associated protein
LTDNKGKVVQRYDYDSFGKLKRQGNKVINTFTYTAREYDRETGLYYYRARYYDPQIGRFISFDPILRGINHTKVANRRHIIISLSFQQPLKLHPFVYALNNTENWIDPWGLWTYATEYGTTGVGLTANIANIEGTVDSIFNSTANLDAVVTYTINGTHGANSLHSSGNAIDLRTRDLSPSQISQVVDMLRNALDSDYDVINEGNHIHIEYDPSCK